MCKGFLVFIVLALVSVPVLAGTYLMNDTGRTVYGLQVTFSEPVMITAFGDALTKVDPTGEATTFTFSGGEVEATSGEWFNLQPASAKLLSDEWIEDSAALNEVRGTCAYVDTTYGIPIVVASITVRDLHDAGIKIGDEISVAVGDTVLIMPLDYPPSVVPEGENLAYLLWGDLRIYNRGKEFPTMYGVTAGTPITVHLKEKGKYAHSTVVTDLDRYWDDDWITEAQSIPLLETASSTLSALHVSGSEIQDASGRVIILRGAAVEDPYWARVANKPLLKRDLLYLKALGANVIHLPLHPEVWKLIGGMAYITDYIDDIVKWGGELGLYVILSWKAHGDPETKEVAEERYDPDMNLALSAVSMLARRYANCLWVMYSVFNEPGAFVRWERFRLCMTDVIDAIREENPQAIVLVPGVDIAVDVSGIPDAPIERDNIVYATDMYPWVWDKRPWKEDAQALLSAGFPLFAFEWGFDVKEDADQFGYSCQYATRDMFGGPFLAFCEEKGISWTAWVWSDDWCPHMFYDYGRVHPTQFGQLILQTLHPEAFPTTSVTTPSILIIPENAAAAGCRAFDRLDGDYGTIPATIVDAEAAGGVDV